METRNLVHKMELVEMRQSLKEEVKSQRNKRNSTDFQFIQILLFSVQLQHVPTPIYSIYGMYLLNSELLAAVIFYYKIFPFRETDFPYLSDACIGSRLLGHNNAIS
jgi:hypothetical protein